MEEVRRTREECARLIVALDRADQETNESDQTSTPGDSHTRADSAPRY